MKKLQLQILFLFSVITLTLSAENESSENSLTTVSGRIITSDGKPAEYIQVFLFNTRFGTQTNDSGIYEFKAPPGN